MMTGNNKNVVLSLSGGLDSSTLLLRCLDEYENITCISFIYGQKHRIEIEKAKNLVEYINSNLDKTKYNPINHHIVELKGLETLLTSGLVDNDSMDLEKGHYAHETALTTVVPNRNAIFASILYAVALSQFKKNGNPCDIALGTHMGDFDNGKKEGIYPDCSEDFRTALEYAFKIGNWDSDKVNYYAPYNDTDKTGVLKSGYELCKVLGLNFNDIYYNTNTSYSPIKSKEGTYCSDIYSGSSIERIESFIKLGLKDPIQYVEEDGTLVDWEYVKNKVEKITEDFNKCRKRD